MQVNRETMRELTTQGKLIEAGWMKHELDLPASMEQSSLDEHRRTYFAGAKHLFAAVITMANPEEGPTQEDVERMESIARELKHAQE